MMKNTIFIIFMFLGFMSTFSYAGFHEYDHYRGWFFGNEEYEEEKEPKPIEKALVPKEKKQDKRESEKKKPPITATEQMELFQKSFEEAKNRAVLNPTYENVREWLYQQRAMWNQADQFSKVFKEVVFSDHTLGSTRNFPTSNYSADAFAIEREMKILEVLKILSQKGQLFFFFDSTCPHSQAQVMPLNNLKKKYGIEYFAISVDGNNIEGLENFRVDNGISHNFGVRMVPALYFVVPKTRELFFISEGILSTASIVERLVVVAKQGNLVPHSIIPQQFNTDKKDNFIDVKDYIRRAKADEKF